MNLQRRLYPVHVDGKSGFIDAQGRIVVDAKFGMAGDFREGLALVGDVFPDETPVMPGLVKRRIGFINAVGEPVTPQHFDMAEGLAAVRPGEAKEMSYIDASGQTVIPAIACALAGPFRDGLARLQGPQGEAVGYINRGGDFVWPMRS